MFMSCRMIDDIRMIYFKYLKYLATVSHGTNQHCQLQIWIFSSKFLLDGISIIFIYIKENQLLWSMTCHLSRQLTADGATTAGNQHRFSGYIVVDFFHIDFYRLSSQQVFYLYFFHGGNRNLPCHKLIHSRQIHQTASCLFTDIQDFSSLFHTGTWYGHINAFDTVLFHCFHYTVGTSEYRDSIYVSSPFIGIIIDKAIYFSSYFF